MVRGAAARARAPRLIGLVLLAAALPACTPTGVAGPSDGSSPSPPASDTGKASKCPSDPRLGVHDPERLKVLRGCVWYRGRVLNLWHSGDGDWHVNVLPAHGYRHFLNGANLRKVRGALVTEVMPGQGFPLPEPGERVSMFGTWVKDTNHGWYELHPIWGIRYRDRGKERFDLPPRKPRADAKGGE